MTALDTVAGLVERFHSHRQAYRSGDIRDAISPAYQLVELVKEMLDLHKRLAAAKTGQDKTVIQRQIDATDRQIDRLVYELYELTDEEIKIVETATR